MIESNFWKNKISSKTLNFSMTSYYSLVAWFMQKGHIYGPIWKEHAKKVALQNNSASLTVQSFSVWSFLNSFEKET